MPSVPKHLYPESALYQSVVTAAAQSEVPEVASALRSFSAGPRTEVVHLGDLQRPQNSHLAGLELGRSLSAPPNLGEASTAILGKRNREADASLALVGDLLQNQSKRMIQLLEEQQNGKVRTRTRTRPAFAASHLARVSPVICRWRSSRPGRHSTGTSSG
jgi:hypothetical protein